MLLKQMTQPDPNKRISFDDINDLFNVQELAVVSNVLKCPVTLLQ